MMKTSVGLVRSVPSSTQLLARILETPDLAAQVQALPAPALARLIDRVGLEDAGEIVALATTQQIADVWDEDLWRSDRVGEDPHLDGDRFVAWLGVMREAGDRIVAQKLAELPEELVTLAIYGQVLVLATSDLAADLGEGGEEADAVEKALSDQLSEELDEYVLVSRHHEGWDDVLAAILALDEHDHDLTTRILERCRRMASREIDDQGGLYDVLTEIESLAGDVAGDREDRRAEKGFVAPSSATAFLRLARGGEGASLPASEHDPLTKAWLRGLSAEGLPGGLAPPPRGGRRLEVLLAEGEGAAPLGLLPSGEESIHAEESLLARSMRALASSSPEKLASRSEELAYLANVLRAGWSMSGRQLRQVEATRAALAIVDEGLAIACRARRERELDERALRVLETHPADGLFRIAWRALHEEPSRLRALFASVTQPAGVDAKRRS
ncbi:MAG: hypothetical protein JST00_45585 [Deltaproteobacteria bacterium]|nr:hypothetical protein [Deltaproteobacteria bacterium]